MDYTLRCARLRTPLPPPCCAWLHTGVLLCLGLPLQRAVETEYCYVGSRKTVCRRRELLIRIPAENVETLPTSVSPCCPALRTRAWCCGVLFSHAGSERPTALSGREGAAGLGGHVLSMSIKESEIKGCGGGQGVHAGHARGGLLHRPGRAGAAHRCRPRTPLGASLCLDSVASGGLL